MEKIDLYPDLVWLFVAFNLAAWYFKGQPLFSWWWMIPVAAVQILIASISLAIIKSLMKR